MPTYAYTCTVCGHSFDVHQSFDDAPLTVCPECSGKLRKVFSPVGVVFKGSGFYRNDARSSSKSTVSSTPATTSTTPPTTSTPSSTSTTTSAPASSAPAASHAKAASS